MVLTLLQQLQPEAEVVSNVPAIALEEVTPSATAQHTLLAPEEIQVSKREREGDEVVSVILLWLQAKSHALDKGDSERTGADKRRRRIAKKWLKRRRGLKTLLQRSGESLTSTAPSTHVTCHGPLNDESCYTMTPAAGSKVAKGSKARQKQSSRYFFASLQQQMVGVANTSRAEPTKTKSSSHFLL